MRREALKWLEDIETHGKECLRFLAGKSETDYVADNLLRAAVERKLFIVGEALSQLRLLDPAIVATLPDLRQIIGFRNMLAHAYFALDHARVFDIATNDLPVLLASVSNIVQAP